LYFLTTDEFSKDDSSNLDLIFSIIDVVLARINF
jgi:hypothetical protein